MNIIEALKTGKRFRRRGQGGWYAANSTLFSKEEIVAEDWEIDSNVDNFLIQFQRLLDTMEREFMEKPTHILISDSLKNKLIYHMLSRPIPDERRGSIGVQYLSYQHGNDMIKFITTKEEI